MKRCLLLFFLFMISLVSACDDFYVARTKDLIYYFPYSAKDDIPGYVQTSENILKEKVSLFGQKLSSPIVVYIDDAIESRRGEADPFKININLNLFFDPKEYTSFETLFAHEIIHILNFKSARNGLFAIDYYLKLGFIPLWLFEGFSEYFSRGEDPFFLFETKKYPFYSANEMNLFYSRNPYNRSGGYSQSYLMARYLYKKYDSQMLSFWKEIPRSGNIYGYMRNKMEPFESFYKEFKKSFLDRTKEKNDHDIIVKGKDVSGFKIVSENIYYLDYYQQSSNQKSLFTKKDKRSLVLKDVHSFCVDKYGVIYFSRLVKKKGNKAKYHIFKHSGKKTIMTNMRGIYPDIEDNILTTSDGKGNILVYDLLKNDLPIKKIKGFYSRLKKGKLYFFDTKNMYLACVSVSFDEKPQRLIKYDKTGFDILFIDDRPYIDVYENGKFYLKTIDNTKKIYYPGGSDLFYHEGILYFRYLKPGYSAVVCQ